MEQDITREQAHQLLSDGLGGYGETRMYGIIAEGETAGQVVAIKSIQNLDRFEYSRIYLITRGTVPIFKA